MGDSGAADSVTCPVCSKRWPADHSICPDDGSWLYEQTLIELSPKSPRRPSLEFTAQSPETTTKGLRVDTTLKGQRHESTARAQRYETPSAGSTAAMPLRGASTDMIAAQLAPPESTEIVPGMQIGEYVVSGKVGEGAMGTVYRAVHPAIGKHVAIKVMTAKAFGEAEAVKRFVGEARAVAAIEHPGIVDVFGFGRIPDGRTYLVMEWLDGQSLATRIEAEPLPFVEACEIIRQIARALEAAHAKGIIHRDLKPENVFLKSIDDERPTVKLLDFGLAKSTNKDEAGLVAKTRSGQMLGTPLYMSPEQCKNKNVDHRTDIYALGCMCFELLVGRTPYDADNVAEIITHHLVAEPPRPSKFKPDIDPDLDRLLYGMIQKDPDRRPPLGEIRRIFGMQVSRASGVSLHTPPEGFAHIASNPFGVALTPQSTPYGQALPDGVGSGVYRPVATPPAAYAPPIDAPPAVSMSDEQMLKAIKTRNGPPWFFWVAVALGIIMVAVALVLA